MKLAWKTREIRLITAAVGISVAAVALVSTDLFAPFTSLSSTAQSARSTVVTTVGSPSNFFPEANAAVPGTSLHSSLVSDGVGGDSGSDNYQLERDSCCIGN